MIVCNCVRESRLPPGHLQQTEKPRARKSAGVFCLQLEEWRPRCRYLPLALSTRMTPPGQPLFTPRGGEDSSKCKARNLQCDLCIVREPAFCLRLEGAALA